MALRTIDGRVMTALPDRDDRVMSLMAAALTLGAEERSRYLHTASDGDEELLRETRDAIEWEERMGGFLQRPWLSLQDLERPFQPGQLINERFEVVRELGHGGMGIVYEAFDHKRGQRIAIKSPKVGFRRLLSPELESALRVRHQNVCLVNEIHTASTDYGDVDFLTMELLEGPTLQEVLSAHGPPDPLEALEISRQLCAGLAEAHRIGVIHKDLKPANVILTRAPDGSRRAVITDFGLAGEPAADGGDLAGTPRYMAPELWRGTHASKASDLYALGVIFYEMVTGATPFGDEPSEVRLTRRPPNAATRSRDVPRRFDAVISQCLEPSPERRPGDAMEILSALAPRSFRKASLAGAIALLAVVAGLLTIHKPAVAVFERPNVRLAILPAHGTGDAAAIADGVLSDVIDRLAHQDALVVIWPAQLAAAGADTPGQARVNLDATHALQLAVRQDGGEVVAHAALIDLATQTRLETISGRYALANAGDLSTALAGAVAKGLNLRGGAEKPLAPAAATAYERGLFYLRRDQHSFDQALPLFREAIRLDPRAPQPRAGLVEALVLKHTDTNEDRWLDEAKRELEAAKALDPDSVAVLLAAGRMDESSGHEEQALDSYRRVAERQPRNVEVWLRIASVNQVLKRTKETIESYRRAIALDPRYYETYEELGVFYFHGGEYAKAAEQFRRVNALAPRFTNGYTNLGAALSEMGQDGAAETALARSLAIQQTPRALNSLAAIRAYQKRDAEAIVLYKEAYARDPGNYICLLNLGDSCRRERMTAESADYYHRGMEVALASLKQNPRDALARAYLASFAAFLGDRSRGEQEIEQALQLGPSEKVVIRRAVVLYETLGHRDRALAIAETATPETLRELDRHPDLADFREDSRFRELKAKKEKGD
jgi:tetratricopeptide (TPR) repeat protein/TolB-like protein